MRIGNRWNARTALVFAGFAGLHKDTGGHCLLTNLYMPRMHVLMRPRCTSGI